MTTAIVMGGDALPTSPGGLVERVTKALQARIRADSLGPGDPLPSENAVASELGVSRAVVREAFRSMAALKLIEIGNGRRARVSAMDTSVLALVLDHVVQTNQISVQQILDVRRTIEMRTVALAALRRSDREAAEIARLAAAMRADFADADTRHGARHRLPRGDRRGLAEPDVRADRRLVQRRHAADLADRLGGPRRPTPTSCDNVDCHEAIARGDHRARPRAAEARMAEHFDNTVKVLLAAGIN